MRTPVNRQNFKETKQADMKKLYASLLLVTLFSGCSKDILKPYDERIIGSWRITEIDRVGIGGSTSNLPFREGTMTFEAGRTLTYVNSSGTYQGTWDLVKKYPDEEEVQRSLQVTAVDFTGRSVLAEYYDDISFRSTDHFVATKQSGTHTYITHFRR
jgi:hypothetical protein